MLVCLVDNVDFGEVQGLLFPIYSTAVNRFLSVDEREMEAFTTILEYTYPVVVLRELLVLAGSAAHLFQESKILPYAYCLRQRSRFAFCAGEFVTTSW